MDHAKAKGENAARELRAQALFQVRQHPDRRPDREPKQEAQQQDQAHEARQIVDAVEVVLRVQTLPAVLPGAGAAPVEALFDEDTQLLDVQAEEPAHGARVLHQQLAEVDFFQALIPEDRGVGGPPVEGQDPVQAEALDGAVLVFVVDLLQGLPGGRLPFGALCLPGGPGFQRVDGALVLLGLGGHGLPPRLHGRKGEGRGKTERHQQDRQRLLPAEPEPEKEHQGQPQPAAEQTAIGQPGSQQIEGQLRREGRQGHGKGPGLPAPEGQADQHGHEHRQDGALAVGPEEPAQNADAVVVVGVGIRARQHGQQLNEHDEAEVGQQRFLQRGPDLLVLPQEGHEAEGRQGQEVDPKEVHQVREGQGIVLLRQQAGRGVEGREGRQDRRREVIDLFSVREQEAEQEAAAQQQHPQDQGQDVLRLGALLPVAHGVQQGLDREVDEHKDRQLFPQAFQPRRMRLFQHHRSSFPAAGGGHRPS